ncbi:MAG: peroxiredoxin [Chloroflexota bacterium]
MAQNLPIPIDDGAANHLFGKKLPSLSLATTAGYRLKLDSVRGFLVIYIYPMTGRPDQNAPEGWASIPGAKGCTAQSCSFRDHYQELETFSAKLYGLSTQATDYQREAKARLHLPFDLLSDEGLTLRDSLSLPTFTVEGVSLYKRLTIIAKDSKIVKVFYPVFPPENNIDEVLGWFRDQAR